MGPEGGLHALMGHMLLCGPRGPGFQWPQAENRCIVPTLGRLMRHHQWPEREAGGKASRYLHQARGGPVLSHHH